IHPKKGLDLLIRAWAGLEADFPDWRLRIVGPAENGHDKELRAIADGLGVQRVRIDGPAFGEDKLAAYRQADLFVLPSRNENFAMTVAEALAAGVPVLCSKGAPWSRLEAEGCGWWVDNDVGSLASSLRVAMSLARPELAAMGRKGRDWMLRE